jgi:hypothetical protein
MDDLGQPGRFPPGPETTTSGHYGHSVRMARGFVGRVPRGWPLPVRLAIQIPLTLLVSLLVLFAWVLATVMLVVSSIGGSSASARY